MRLYRANVILTEAIQPLTTADNLTPTQIDNIKNNDSAAKVMDKEDKTKQWRWTNDDETGKRTIEKYGQS